MFSCYIFAYSVCVLATLLRLLPSRFSCAWLCATPQTAAPQNSISWDSPGKNTGAGCPSLLQGICQPRDWTQVSWAADKFFTIGATMFIIYVFSMAAFMTQWHTWVAVTETIWFYMIHINWNVYPALFTKNLGVPWPWGRREPCNEQNYSKRSRQEFLHFYEEKLSDRCRG